jgi:hypothetical protein
LSRRYSAVAVHAGAARPVYPATATSTITTAVAARHSLAGVAHVRCAARGVDQGPIVRGDTHRGSFRTIRKIGASLFLLVIAGPGFCCEGTRRASRGDGGLGRDCRGWRGVGSQWVLFGARARAAGIGSLPGMAGAWVVDWSGHGSHCRAGQMPGLSGRHLPGACRPGFPLHPLVQHHCNISLMQRNEKAQASPAMRRDMAVLCSVAGRRSITPAAGRASAG